MSLIWVCGEGELIWRFEKPTRDESVATNFLGTTELIIRIFEGTRTNICLRLLNFISNFTRKLFFGILCFLSPRVPRLWIVIEQWGWWEKFYDGGTTMNALARLGIERKTIYLSIFLVFLCVYNSSKNHWLNLVDTPSLLLDFFFNNNNSYLAVFFFALSLLRK